MTFSSWVSGEVTAVENFFESEEAAVVKYFGPLISQVVTAVTALGKADFAAGLQVLTDSVTAAVAAGAAAAATGGNAVTAAETTFLATGASEGITAIHNAESGLIKAGVAIAQSAAAAVASTAADAVAGLAPAAPVTAPATGS